MAWSTQDGCAVATCFFFFFKSLLFFYRKPHKTMGFGIPWVVSMDSGINGTAKVRWMEWMGLHRHDGVR